MKSINQYIQEKLILTKNIIDKNTKNNYLQFKAVEDNSIISLKSKTDPNIEYSFDCKEWIDWDYSDIKLDKGQIIYMRGDNPNGFNSSYIKYNYFKITGKIEASGNIMSLLYKTKFNVKLNIPCDYCFYKLFYECEALITPPELPAIKLADACYYCAFYKCTSLISAPKLPATNLTKWCYCEMFECCTSLISAPELPATNLTERCYRGMFNGCTSLTQAPELPATTLADWCYYEMFNGCTSLTQAPELLATELTEWCYNSMFLDCTSLTKAPELPAAKLADYCYAFMFYKCKSLTQKPKIAADINNKNCEDMFKGCPCENK